MINKQTKIICTLGPSSDNYDTILKMATAGMNIVRLNFSHGTHEEHEAKFRRLVRLRREMGLPVATLLDTKGPEIRLRDLEGGKVILAVNNDGATIPAEDIPHVFDRFYRVDKARVRSEGGVGLGLAIAQEVAREHGGSIAVTSSEASGTTFTATLPRVM
jgi:pyruvate kinase